MRRVIPEPIVGEFVVGVVVPVCITLEAKDKCYSDRQVFSRIATCARMAVDRQGDWPSDIKSRVVSIEQLDV